MTKRLPSTILALVYIGIEFGVKNRWVKLLRLSEKTIGHKVNPKARDCVGVVNRHPLIRSAIRGDSWHHTSRVHIEYLLFDLTPQKTSEQRLRDNIGPY